MGCKRFLIDSNHPIAKTALKARDEAIEKLQIRDNISGVRINQLRKKNFGYITFDINGIKTSAIAHSKVNISDTSVDPRAKYFISKLPKQQYKTYEVGPFRNNVSQCGINVWNRDVCTESKLLEILNLVFNASAVGWIKLYTVKIPCISCDNVIYKFLKDHPYIDMEVYFEENDDYKCKSSLL